MKRRPNILLTNDDGINAPGIKHLWRALKAADIADVTIIAPASEKSGTGASITWDKPILINKVQWEDGVTQAYSIGGTPADCVKLGSRIVLGNVPDFIVSGINAGSNAGRNVLHSGTVGAVIEGVFRGIPGVAFSCENGQAPNFHVAELYIGSIMEYLFANPLPPGVFFNVNFPHAAQDKVKGFKVTRQGKGRWVEDPLLHLESETGSSYWLGGKPEELDEEDGCDIDYLRKGYMTASPIQVHDLTANDVLKNVQSSFESIFSLG